MKEMNRTGNENKR